MHGYMLKLGNPFLTQWQRRYFYLFPNRVEWRGEGESRVSNPHLYFTQSPFTVRFSWCASSVLHVCGRLSVSTYKHVLSWVCDGCVVWWVMGVV